MRYLLPNNVFGVGISRAALSRTRTIRVPIVKLRMMKKKGMEFRTKLEPTHVAWIGCNKFCTAPLMLTYISMIESDGWDKCWKQGLIPWDLGRPTPLLKRLHETGSLPRGTALLPGCGTGYDVVAIACPERYVVGIDISDSAIEKAVEADFFTWHPTHLFDLIFDHTFFCAIEPDLRSRWAEKIRDILKPDGELITLMFPISDHVGGPPYNVSVSDYEEVLHPIGFKATLIMDNELAVGPRKGREKIGRWKRCLRKSSL